jgi:hypothetical protein
MKPQTPLFEFHAAEFAVRFFDFLVFWWLPVGATAPAGPPGHLECDAQQRWEAEGGKSP